MTLRRFFLGPICAAIGVLSGGSGHEPRWVDAPELRGDFYVYPCKRCGVDLLPHPFAAVEKPEDERVV